MMNTNDLINLIGQMSLEEKVGQMIQLPVNMLLEKDSITTGPIETISVSQEQLGLIGSVLNKITAQDAIKIQKEFTERHPHHIPLLFMHDVINGMETIFPIPLAQGCSFSPELVENIAKISAKEAAVTGCHVTFSPMLDLVRDARWGRVMESTGEDPFLNARLGEAMVRGYQDHTLSNEYSVASCIKHFAGYGYPEGGRDYDNAEISERTLREDFLPAYKAAIEEGCAMVMASFNTLNRIPSAGNSWLMRKVLREEMEFKGVLISDYYAVEEMVLHGFASHSKEAAKKAILAGIDIDMVSNAYVKYLAELVRSGEVDEELVDEAVLRILTLKNELGLFENPYKDASVEHTEQFICCEEHLELARKAACDTFVLLKNEEILPLSKTSSEKIAFIGPFIDNYNVYGAWSFPSIPESCVTIRQGVIQKRSDLLFSEGCFLMDSGSFTRFSETERYSEDELLLKMNQAIELASNVDKVVICLGEHRQQSGEAGSRSNISLPKRQIELFEKIHSVNPNIITVIFSGRPLDITKIDTMSKATIMVWYPGSESGNAIADVLFGDNEPGGRLSMSVPRSVGQLPICYNRFATGRPNPTGSDIGYKTGYIDESMFPLYPFGYGLTFTKFVYTKVMLDKNQMQSGESIIATVEITNDGNCIGTEVVQLYLRDVSGSVVRPQKMLRGFQKVILQPRETKEVSFIITEELLKFYDINMDYTSESGKFLVFIGSDSQTDNVAEFELL